MTWNESSISIERMTSYVTDSSLRSNSLIFAFPHVHLYEGESENGYESVQDDSNRHGPFQEDHDDRILFHGMNHGHAHTSRLKVHPCVCREVAGNETGNEGF